MSENPDDWRSAVDATCGRTYWYHRKTRVSTWIKPDFAENSVTDTNLNEVTSNNRIEDSVSTEKDVVTHSDQSSKSSTFKSTINKICTSPNNITVMDYKYVMEYVSSQHLYMNENAGEVITDFVNMVIQSSNTISSNNVSMRHTALRCLCYLSTCFQRSYAGEHFHAHQAWTALIAYAPRWKGSGLVSSSTQRTEQPQDVESILLLGALYCNLLVGPCFYLISAECKTSLCELLENLFIHNTDAAINFDILTASTAPGGTTSAGSSGASSSNSNSNSTSPSAGVGAVLDDRAVQCFSLLAEKGHRLPAVWLLSIFTQSFR